MTWNHIIRKDENGKVIGDLEWAERPGKTFEMHLDVDPGHHRKGIGRSMFEELQEHVKEVGGMSIYSFSAGDNYQAKGFFTGVGFEATWLPEFYGEGRNAWFYHKPVGKPK